MTQPPSRASSARRWAGGGEPDGAAQVQDRSGGGEQDPAQGCGARQQAQRVGVDGLAVAVVGVTGWPARFSEGLKLVRL
jgi:hypothetical protein